jgi:hypothetical protein
VRWPTLTFALLLAIGPDRALAFHDGGVGACEGCHTMHNSQGGAAVATGVPQYQAGPYLLKASDQSGVCLNCHGGITPSTYRVFTLGATSLTPPSAFTPGGDFAWLTRDYAWTGSTQTELSPGERHGHSIVWADRGLASDSMLTRAPGGGTGGGYPSSDLTCISCHDPHGRSRLHADGTQSSTGSPIKGSGSYGGTAFRQPDAVASVGAYRLLGGVGYSNKAAGSTFAFQNPAPIALAPTDYSRSERTIQVRVAYGKGMSEWCANCHAGIHVQTLPPAYSTSIFVHPAGGGALLTAGGEAAIYNQYVRTGVLTGSQATSYASLVPFEEGTDQRLALAPHATSDGSAPGGPVTGVETVTCLSCHRAHATAWDHAVRWNMPASGLITIGGAWPGLDATGAAGLPANAQGRTQAETRAGMYDRDASSFAPYQKVLCNKCHAKD